MTTPKKRGRVPMADAVLIKDIQRVASLLKKNTVGLNQYKKLGLYGVSIYELHFGSWNKAVIKANLKPHCWSTEKELLDDLKKVAKEIKPSQLKRESYEAKGKYSRSMYIYRFGSWSEAMKKAGLPLVRTRTRQGKQGAG